MITGLSNSAVKEIRRLVRDRKARQESDLFYIEGLRIVAEALRQAAPVRTLIYSPALLVSSYGQNLVEEAAGKNIDLMEVSEDVFRSFSLKEGPQGIAALVKPCWSDLDEISIRDGDLWTALYQVADPGNLGTILRTMDAVGGRGVILLDHSTDPFDPSAVRASMGAVFSQKLVRADFAQFKIWKTANSVAMVGTSDAAATDYHTFRYSQTLVLLMGSERQGLPTEYADLCDDMVSIPMLGVCDSLNLSVATGIVLYEILNHRRDAGKSRERPK